MEIAPYEDNLGGRMLSRSDYRIVDLPGAVGAQWLIVAGRICLFWEVLLRDSP